MGQVTVFSGPERRRRWRDEERLRILSEAFAPGACAAEVARRHDVSTGLLYTWRSKLAARSTPLSGDPLNTGFAEALLVAGPDVQRSGSDPALVVDLPRGRRVTIFSGTSAVLVAAALKALR